MPSGSSWELRTSRLVLAVNAYGRIVYRGESMTLPAAAQLIEGREYKPEPKLSPQEIQDLIRQSAVTPPGIRLRRSSA